jgi:hypothetical protein
MTIHHDTDRGWSEWQGEPRWRANTAALNRLTGADVAWTTGNAARVASVVGHDGRTLCNVATLRHVPAHRQWIVRIEGYQFWGHDRLLGHEHYKDVTSFPTVGEARRLVETILRQSSANIIKRKAAA